MNPQRAGWHSQHCDKLRKHLILNALASCERCHRSSFDKNHLFDRLNCECLKNSDFSNCWYKTSRGGTVPFKRFCLPWYIFYLLVAATVIYGCKPALLTNCHPWSCHLFLPICTISFSVCHRLYVFLTLYFTCHGN